MDQQWEYCIVRHSRSYVSSVEYAGFRKLDERDFARQVPLGEALAFLEHAGWQHTSTIDVENGQISDFKRNILPGRAIMEPSFPGRR